MDRLIHTLMRRTVKCIPALALVLSLCQGNGAESRKLAFVPSGPGEFVFDTGVLKGKLGGEKPKGLSAVIHIPSGARLDASMGLLSHYRVFSDGKRYGVGAWDWPADSTLEADGSVVVRRSPTDDRPFEFTAVYRWVTPNTIDLETIVKAKTDLHAFESFVANYFTKSFTNALICAKGNSSAILATPQFVAAEERLGSWQAFPRDALAAEVMRDGRWNLEPNPVDWTVQGYLAKPIAARAAPAFGLAAVLMSMPEDCFAICTPHQTEAHYSMYLSLFGHDLKAGQTQRAHTRLTILPQFSPAEAERAYAQFARRR